MTAEVQEPLQLVPNPADVEAPVGTARADSSGSRMGRFASWVFLIAVCVYFMFPLLMLRGGFPEGRPHDPAGGVHPVQGLDARTVGAAIRAPNFGSTLWLSARLAVGAIFVTLALMLPTAMWVHLRIPKARGIVETLTVLPYVVPPIALVVGVIGAFQGAAPWFYRSNYLLVPFYAILAMPFTYRALDAGIRAIDLRTLVDASRSLGAGWGTTMFRVLIPNMRASLLTSSFLTATIVLGEFTMASLTGKQTLPTFQQQLYAESFQQASSLGFVTLIVTVGAARGCHVRHPPPWRGRRSRLTAEASTTMASSLTFTGIRKTFSGAAALESFSLAMEPGELVSLLGPSGCGKTTALRIAAGFERPDSGAVLVDDRNVLGTPAHKRNMGMVFQSYSLFPNLDVKANVAFGLRVRSVSKADQARRVGEALERVQLSQMANRYPTSSRAASSSGWRSPVPSCSSPPCSCSTSRCRPSTPRCA